MGPSHFLARSTKAAEETVSISVATGPHLQHYTFRSASRPKRSAHLFGIAQFSDDAAREKILDLTMARDRLAQARTRVLIPIVFATVANEHAAHRGELLKKLDPLHGT